MERHRHTEEEKLFTELVERAARNTEADWGTPSYTSSLIEKRPRLAKREAAYSVGMMANVAILTSGFH